VYDALFLPPLRDLSKWFITEASAEMKGDIGVWRPVMAPPAKFIGPGVLCD
jgi:hypothetical protein